MKLNFNTQIKPFGVPIYFHISVLLWFIYLGYMFGPMLGFISTIILIFSVAIHEYGHVYIAQKNGVQVNEVVIHGLGGFASMPGDSLIEYPLIEAKVAVAGPIVSLFLAVIGFGLSNLVTGYGFLPFIIKWFTILNLILSIFNILPIFPMDGGRLFRALLTRKYDDIVKATKISTYTTYILCSILTVVALVLHDILLLFVIGLIVWMAYKEKESIDLFYR